MAGIYINIEESGGYLGMQQAKLQAMQSYNRALCKEVAHYAESHGSNETIESVYVSGPLHLIPPDTFARLIETVFVEFDTGNIQEITADLEPEAVTDERLHLLESLGFTRLNLLSRSFFDEDLKRLECTYRAHDLHTAIERIQGAAFNQLSTELYYDIGDQPFEYWAANFEKVVHLKVDHVSLRSHKETARVGLPRQLACCFFFPELEELLIERLAFAMDYLREAGYEQYLLMEFAQEASRSRHAMLHVYQANMLGIGPGAHSFWWHGASHSKAHRWANVDNIAQYIALLKQRELPVDSRSVFGLDHLANDFIMLTLQTPEGIDTQVLETEYGVDLYSEKIDVLAWLESEGWIEPVRNGKIRLSPTGRLHTYQIVPKLLLDI